MMRQIIRPLQRLHKNGYVHRDIKPENICVQMRPGFFKPKLGTPYQTIFEFRLIDFGILCKFKERKLMKVSPVFVGTLMYASVRGLRHEQTRYHDDIESLLNVAIYLIFQALPWEERRVRIEFGLDRLKGPEYRSAFKLMRLSKKRDFERQMISHFGDGMRKCSSYKELLFAIGKSENEVNPIYRLLNELSAINTKQQKIVTKHNLCPTNEEMTRTEEDALIEKAQKDGLREVFEPDWYHRIEEILNFPDGVFCFQSPEDSISREQSKNRLRPKAQSVYQVKMQSMVNGECSEKVQELEEIPAVLQNVVVGLKSQS